MPSSIGSKVTGIHSLNRAVFDWKGDNMKFVLSLRDIRNLKRKIQPCMKKYSHKKKVHNRLLHHWLTPFIRQYAYYLLSAKWMRNLYIMYSIKSVFGISFTHRQFGWLMRPLIKQGLVENKSFHRSVGRGEVTFTSYRKLI